MIMPGWFYISLKQRPALACLALLFFSSGHTQNIDSARQAAIKSQAALLAPELFEDAEESYADAEKFAEKNPDKSAQAAQTAGNLYTQAERLAGIRAKQLRAALAMRSVALQAGAYDQDNDLWQQAEKFFAKAVSALASDRADVAQRNAEFAAQYYDAAELDALQNRILRPARDLFKTADQLRAARYAPITLQLGRDFANSAKLVLQRDRSLIPQAQELGDQAAAFAARSIQITKLANQKPTLEEVIISWEGRLESVERATGRPASSTLDPDIRVAELANEIERLRLRETALDEELQESRKFNAALEEEIRELDIKLGGASAERRKMVIELESQARAREQLNQAKALFTPDEARVFSQSSQIVVRLLGLKFASGSSRLDSKNDDLLLKLGKLIAIYPGSRLLVEGHTDSQGGEIGNQQLSQARADAVLNRMVAEMRIAAQRISAIGYGETRPIANNETESGRIQNRRIDLIISPAASMDNL